MRSGSFGAGLPTRRGERAFDQRPVRAGPVRTLAQHLPELPATGLALEQAEHMAVSYTHLTLPTICSV